mmetsp:Transcript_979/g.2153  ORF Transcript_979/g.2153 Transcript_979/m.2153 type:complete len:153 (+) Transcript_979:868-1326(+)
MSTLQQQPWAHLATVKHHHGLMCKTSTGTNAIAHQIGVSWQKHIGAKVSASPALLMMCKQSRRVLVALRSSQDAMQLGRHRSHPWLQVVKQGMKAHPPRGLHHQKLHRRRHERRRSHRKTLQPTGWTRTTNFESLQHFDIDKHFDNVVHLGS